MIKTTFTDRIVTSDESYASFKKEVINDYFLAVVSREASLLARKEVLTGKAKFGIIGDGKELPQIAMAKSFKKGDWRSGYYRDQTFMFATGLSTVEDFFAQLYADVDNDPFTGGRQMNSHYASPILDDSGEWLDTTKMYNVTGDVSCTGGQMARALGVAMASKQYRNRKIKGEERFSKNGNEVSFVTIGDASTSEGGFWETMNAAAVMKVPLITCVWDDGYGISVPIELQTVKGSISRALEGFHIDENGDGIYLYTAKAWDYQEMCRVFEKASRLTRENHIPALIHIQEVTQPQGHSTSGSHERYKSAERLKWEEEYDCIVKFGQWMKENGLVEDADLEALRTEAKTLVKEAKNRAWKNYTQPIENKVVELKRILKALSAQTQNETIHASVNKMDALINPVFSEVLKEARRISYQARLHGLDIQALAEFIENHIRENESLYARHLYDESGKSGMDIPVVHPVVSEHSPTMNGYQVLNTYFDKKLAANDSIIAFGEDVGNIGDVNQGFAGLQEKYGEDRVFDTGIREWTIIGQGIGAAMRGLRPIAEIQYLDYITYAFSPLTDDLATVRYRTNGIQQAPMIVRTRGHRLEGIWHAGSPLGVLINALRGMHVCVPRNMVQAAGMYETLLQSNDPGLVIECLNGYRLKEVLPDNIGEFTVPLGVPEVLRSGQMLTLVTYGSCVRIAEEACAMLAEHDIDVELIDVQTLLPFDLEHRILDSLKKTSRLLIVDEDVPGGASAYILQQVLEIQDGYRYLDSKPVTLTAKAHRTPFGSDGDYFSKPNTEDVFEAAYRIMEEAGLV